MIKKRLTIRKYPKNKNSTVFIDEKQLLLLSLFQVSYVGLFHDIMQVNAEYIIEKLLSSFFFIFFNNCLKLFKINSLSFGRVVVFGTSFGFVQDINLSESGFTGF
ncbi:MAG: hypothetical protein DRR19_20470 [Candidatus Parabeggiatoa sp. nov. 1]|nr:MAG: hypothetical protein DRR19_20470 [Gammaproteobacteria bacterium]